MQLMSGDQSGPVVELEGPLLSDSHIPFKVKAQLQLSPETVADFYSFLINTEVVSSPSAFQFVPTAYDAFARAGVPQCQLHL